MRNPFKLASPTTPARKAAPPTSYNAGANSLAASLGLEPPDTSVTSEQGSQLATPIREFVPELASPYQRSLVYNEMMNDSGVDASMRAVKTPVLGAEFYVDPWSSDPQDVLVAQFITQNLMGGLNDPILSSLEDILHMCEDGYSVLEKVYELRGWSPSAKGSNTKQYTMLKDLAVRPTGTLQDITYDNNGRLASLNQNAIQGDRTQKLVPLDANKLLVFTLNRKGGDITGKSLLRTAYPHWFYKSHFYKIDAVQKERQALGVPRGKLLPGYTPNDLKVLRNLLRNLRANEESFVIQTPNIEIDFIETHGVVIDVLASAGHHNMMILLNVLAQFLGLGLGEGAGSGGRATGSTQSDIFMKSLKYIANLICEIINMHVIPELVIYNFPTNNFPQLCVRNIGETRDLQMLGSALGNLFSQDALTPDAITENWIRKTFDMPLKDPATYVDPKEAAQSNNGNGTASSQKGATKNGKGTGNVGKPPSSQY